MPDTTRTTLLYAAAASLAAWSLYYVFGPTLIPGDPAPTHRNAGAVGLSNPANDCFVNSVLQALAASTKLRDFLANEVKNWHVEDDSPNEPAQDPGSTETRDPAAMLVTKALRMLLARLNNHSLAGKTISARSFIQSLEYAFGTRLNRQQQDAHEFLQKVVERLDDEMSARQRTSKEHTDHGQGLGDQKAVKFPLEGQLESHSSCKRCSTPTRHEKTTFTVLSLNVPQQSSVTIDDCLDVLLRVETIQDYHCDHCAVSPSSKTTLGRFTRIAEFPQVMVLHLSRSMYIPGSHSRKNDAKVKFAETLQFGGLETQRNYDLVSVVTHRGGHNSGHYETFRRQSPNASAISSGENLHGHAPESTTEKKISKRKRSNKWWAISDAKVRQCTTDEMLSKQKEVYLLFYELVQPD